MSGIRPSTPLDFIDFLLYFKRLQVIELRLMGLELRMEFIFAGCFLESDVLIPIQCMPETAHSRHGFFRTAQLSLLYHLLPNSCRYDQTRQSI